MHTRTLFRVVGLLLSLPLLGAAAAAMRSAPPTASSTGIAPGDFNILVIVLDDLGTDKLNFYRPLGAQVPAGRYPKIPALADLRANGVLFTNAYATPVCSPSRAQLMCGKYGFRTGVTNVITESSPPCMSLADAEEFVSERLSSIYAKGAFGKWHLSLASCPATPPCSPYPPCPPTTPCDPACHAIRNGFDVFDGHLKNNEQYVPLSPFNGHWGWPRVTASSSGGSCTSSVVMNSSWDASVTRKEARGWIDSQVGIDRPFFAYVAFNPPHGPQQVPPFGNLSSAPGGTVDQLQALGLAEEDIVGPPAGNPPCATATAEMTLVNKAQIEALDFEIDLLVDGLPENTMIFVVGDNGPPYPVNEVDEFNPATVGPPYAPLHGKRSLYQLGIRIPLIVAGPLAAANTECSGLVGMVDMWNTIAEVGGAATNPLLDSVSFLPSIVTPGAHTLRQIVYSDFPNIGVTYAGGVWSDLCGPVSPPRRAMVYKDPVSGGLYKYMRSTTLCVSPPPCPTCSTPACPPPSGYCPGMLVQPDEELYTLDTDPNELCNRLCDPTLAGPLGVVRTAMTALTGL